MAEMDNHDEVQALILNAIKQKDPGIQPGQTFDWLIINNKLRHSVTPERFVSGMRALATAGLIGADETRRRFVLTEKGVEAQAKGAPPAEEKAA
jgi:hypothetical protein